GPGGPQNATQRHFTMANLACYPAINVPNGFAENGQPTNVTFYARPFAEAPLLALAKAYQDAAKFHLRRPPKLEAPAAAAERDRGAPDARPMRVGVQSARLRERGWGPASTK